MRSPILRSPTLRSPVPRIAVAALVAILLSAAALVAAPAANARRVGPELTMTVVNVTPNTPQVSSKPKPLTFTVELVNHYTKPMDVSVSVARSDPINNIAALDSAIAHPKPPSPGLVSPLTATARTIVPVGKSVLATIHTTTAPFGHDGVCLCNELIYPFWFIGSYTAGDTSGQATAQTFMPSFPTQPKKSTVSWVWPLLDRPHRLLRPNVFLDDVLADEVSRGGRLLRLLQVVQQVSPTVPMTIVTDPDLIDELAVMAQGYQVDTPNGLVAGTGSAAARGWLSALRVVLDSHPDVQLVFTPFADPAVDSLSRAHMNWSVTLDQAARDRVKTALDGRIPATDITWPAGGTLTANTLSELVSQGTKTVIVNDTALTRGTVDPVPDALAPASTGAGPATLAVTSAPIERLTARVLDPSADGDALLPELVSRLALRLMTNGPRYTVITPPRDLDVSVPVAVRTIEATADSPWSRPLTLGQAVGDPSIAHVDRGTLRRNSRGPDLGSGLLRTLRGMSNDLPQLTSMFQDPSVAARISSPVPFAVQRTTSSSLLDDRDVSAAMAARLAQIINSIRGRVYIVRPADGTYTLTSSDSQLPVTVVNHLNADINVKVSVQTAGGAPGLTAVDPDKTWPVKADSKVQVHIALHADRVGRIKLIARISTPDGLYLGYGKRETPLSVRSTALGTIGVIITILAAIALALAVVYRQVRRLRRRGATPKEPEPPVVVAATTASSVQ